MATMSAMTPKFIRMSVGPAPGSTGGVRRAGLDSGARRSVPLLAAARRCRHYRRRGGPPPRDPRQRPRGRGPGHRCGWQPCPAGRVPSGRPSPDRGGEDRDQDVGEHVAGEQDATVRKEDRGVADGVRRPPDSASVHFVRCLRPARVATPFGSGFGTGGRPPKRTHMPPGVRFSSWAFEPERAAGRQRGVALLHWWR